MTAQGDCGVVVRLVLRCWRHRRWRCRLRARPDIWVSTPIYRRQIQRQIRSLARMKYTYGERSGSRQSERESAAGGVGCSDSDLRGHVVPVSRHGGRELVLAPNHLERVMEHKRNLQHVHNTYAIRILITNWEDEPLDYSTRWRRRRMCCSLPLRGTPQGRASHLANSQTLPADAQSHRGTRHAPAPPGYLLQPGLGSARQSHLFFYRSHNQPPSAINARQTGAMLSLHVTLEIHTS